MNGAPTGLAAPPDPGLAARLRRMRRAATALLVVLAVVFIATTWLLPPSPWLGAARAFAEAALIGGLADWFAVTALFRRPLGLPIPHTAIVPTRKNEIGRALARFIRDHFLVREAVARRLERADLAARLGTWLDDEANAARISRDASAALDFALRAGDGCALRDALGATLRDAFDAAPVSKALATVLEVLTTGRRAQSLIDRLVSFARTELDRHRGTIRERIHERSPWWLPKFVDQEIYDKLTAELDLMLDAIATDPDHPARRELEAMLLGLRESLATDGALAEKSRELQNELVAHPAVREYAADLWQTLGNDLRAALADARSPLRLGIASELRALGAALRSDASVAARLDDWLKEVLLYIVDNYRDPLSEIVSETIESWDAEATSRRIELHIGRDLQFIRVNGTLVGGLIGLAIYLVAAAIG